MQQTFKLPNDCYRSKISVHPKNWKTKRAPLSSDWYIQYRFHDPTMRHLYPKGKLRVVRGDANAIDNLQDRQNYIADFLENETVLLDEGYNP